MLSLQWARSPGGHAGAPRAPPAGPQRRGRAGFGLWGVPQAPGGREGLCPGTHAVFLVHLLCCMSGVMQTPLDVYLYKVTAHL